MNIPEWLREIQDIVDRIREAGDIYQITGTEVDYEVDLQSLDQLLATYRENLPPDFVEFYKQCGSVSLSAIHNGYFIPPLRLICESEAQLIPLRISGRHAGEVLTIGSDFGGRLFVMRLDESHEIAYLIEGVIESGTYFEQWDDQYRRVAPDFSGFLERVLEDAKAYLEGRADWVYMSS